MEEPTISTEDVRKQMIKIKDNKAPGPDGIKPEQKTSGVATTFFYAENYFYYITKIYK